MSSIAARLAAIEGRIARACGRVGRDRQQLTLVAASKSQPTAAIEEAIAAGQRVFGENRVQEAQSKAAALGAMQLHLLGPLQSNKVKVALSLFDTLHALDRPSIIDAVEAAAGRLGRPARAFVEVNLGAEPSKHGFLPGELVAQGRDWNGLRHLELVGLMAIPPPEDDPARARHWFRMLARLRDEVGERLAWPGFRGALSMGMSDDFELAIEEGASHVRVGTALFGSRGPRRE